MIARLKPIIAILLTTGAMMPTLVHAATNTEQTNSAAMQRLALQAKKLELQLASLQSEMHSMQGQSQDQSQDQSIAQKPSPMRAHARKHKHTHRKPTAPNSSMTAAEADDSAYNQDQPKKLTARELRRMISEEREYLPFDLDVPGQAFVSTGPYVGVPISYSGSNLIVNSPSVNTDVQLLGIRKSIHTQLMAMGGEIYKEPYHSHLLLSGALNGQASYLNHSGPANGGLPSTNIDVTGFSFDTIVFGPSDWTLAFVEFNYDNSSPAGSVYTSSSPSTPIGSYNSYTLSNSRLFINKAFATIGDFSKSPFFATFGQVYVPYGVYSSVFLSSPFTQTLGRTKARAIEVGFQQQDYAGFYGAAFIFRGDSHASSTNKVNNGGLNIGYKYGKEYIHTTFGASILGNIADSGGMQLGTGFGKASGNEQIAHRVPGYNLRGTFGIGTHFDVIAEFIATTNTFSSADMSYNGHGAKPWALDTEAAYSFYILDNRPSSIGIGYQKSNQALAMGVPLTRYSAVMRTSLFRNTLQGLEFRHDREYAAGVVATGAGGVASSSQTGKCDNAVTAEFDYFF